MSALAPPANRDPVRSRIVEAAAALLDDEGLAAVTTRAVCARAGVQAPTIYRLFGDKDGLLDAVAESGFAAWVAKKQRRRPHPDPVQDVRAGWRTMLAFGLSNPGLAVLMADPRRATHSPAVAAGAETLRAKVHRLAEAGLLAVPESRAVDLLHASGTGVVLSLLAVPEDQRDDGLSEIALESALAAILVSNPGASLRSDRTAGGAVAAAVTLRAELGDVRTLSGTERALLADWLDRVAAG